MSDWSAAGRVALVAAGYYFFGPLGAVGGAYLGGVLFPAKFDSEMPTIHDYPVQSSAVGIPVAIVLGSGRIAGNVIWLGELIAYQIKHSSGGKGGGGKQVTYETRYKRSFLIAICEGTAAIKRAWKGKIEVPLTDFTTFDGDGNVGISAIIGEDYAEYDNLCCAYFEEYELGNAQALPNFIFEVASVPSSDLVFGGDDTSLTWLDFDLTGVMDFDIPGLVRDIAFYSNRGVFAVTETGNLYRLTKEGILDASWRGGGIVAVNPQCRGVLLHSSGSIFVTYRSGAANAPSMSKFASDGTLIWEKQFCASLISIEWQNKMIEHKGNIIATLSSNWPEDDEGIGVRIDVDGNVLNNYKDAPLGGQDLEGFDVAIDSNENVYIAHNRGISKFRLDGTWICNNYVFPTDYVKPVYGVTIAQVDGIDKVFITATQWYGDSIFRMSTDLVIEKSYDIGNTTARCPRIHQGSLYVASNLSPVEDIDIWKFDLDLNFISGSKSVDSVVQYAIAIPKSPNDMNFAEMIKELLTNERYGNYQASDLITEDFDSAIAYCEVLGLKGSLIITEQKPLPDWLAYICTHFQGYFYEIGGKVGLNCYRNQPSVLSITQDDLIRAGNEPPVHIAKRAYSSTYNRLEVAWTDRDNNYKIAIVPAFDRVDQRESGQVRTKVLDLKAICDKELAVKMAWRIFIDQMYRFSQYTFRLGYKSMLLEVGDMIDVTDGHLLVAKKMRVMSIVEEKDGRRAVITAVEDIAELYPSVEYPTQESESEPDPGITLTDGSVAFRENYIDNRLFLSITPGGAKCNGFYIYKSYDDDTYELVGRSSIENVTGGEANSAGTLLSSLPAYPAVVLRRDETFRVSIGAITDLDTSITDAAFFNNQKIVRVGNEIIAYKTCVESPAEGLWEISNLIRGLFGTEPVAHSKGEMFYTLDVSFAYLLQESDVGKTIYFKVVSYYSDIVQPISDVSAYSFAVSGKHLKPLPVSLMRINGREGMSTYETADALLDWYFCSKTSGFGRGGYGNALWGAYTIDPLLEQLKIEIEEEDGTAIIDGTYTLTDYNEPIQLEILEADRNGKNPIRVKITPGSHLWSDESREILIEKI